MWTTQPAASRSRLHPRNPQQARSATTSRSSSGPTHGRSLTSIRSARHLFESRFECGDVERHLFAGFPTYDERDEREPAERLCRPSRSLRCRLRFARSACITPPSGVHVASSAGSIGARGVFRSGSGIRSPSRSKPAPVIASERSLLRCGHLPWNLQHHRAPRFIAQSGWALVFQSF